MDTSKFLTQLKTSTASSSTVSYNVAQNYIVITEDKTRIILSGHQKKLLRKYSWGTPLGIFLAIFVSLPTAVYQDFLIPGRYWKFIFIFGTIGTLLWLLVRIIESINMTLKNNKPIIEVIIEDMKGQSSFSEKYQEKTK